jgi:2-methylcitrate dehydratase PrpD
MAAVMVMDKTVTFMSAHDKARMKDPATLRERAKVKLIPDEQLERLMPLRVAIVEVQLTDGTHFTQRVDNVRGTPKNPMTTEEIVGKARDLTAPILGTAQCAELIERVLNLDKVKDVRELRPLLQRA